MALSICIRVPSIQVQGTGVEQTLVPVLSCRNFHVGGPQTNWQDLEICTVHLSLGKTSCCLLVVFFFFCHIDASNPMVSKTVRWLYWQKAQKWLLPGTAFFSQLAVFKLVFHVTLLSVFCTSGDSFTPRSRITRKNPRRTLCTQLYTELTELNVEKK